MAELEGLSGEEMEKLLQFQDLTGIEDINECKDTLQRHAWDLEVAVQDTLNVREGRPSVFQENRAPPTSGHDLGVDVIPHRDNFLIPERAPNQSFISYVITIVYNVVTQSVWTIFNFFARYLRPDNRQIESDMDSSESLWSEDMEQGSDEFLSNFVQIYHSAELHNPYVPGVNGGALRSEPVEDVESFIERFNESYTGNAEMRPAFWRSSYSQALAAAKQELKFLLIYLHCKDHQHTNQFCRDTLCSLLLLEYLRQANWLLWGCDVSSCEGYRVSQALRENSYPFLAVAVLRGTRMTVVARFEGPIMAEDLVTTLRNVVAENEMSLVAARAERNERSFTQSLRRQQDEAYEESLLADQLKEMRRREQLEAERQAEERERQEREALVRKKEEIARLKIELADRVPVEPDSTDSEAVHLVIKLPSGRRLERRFLAHHSMQDVYHYVFCHPESPDEFEIATNFPKRVLAQSLHSSSVQTLQQAGLRGKQALFVYDLQA